MFYYKESFHFLVNIHLNEKINFYTYKYFSLLKSILIFMKYIGVQYSVFNNNIFDRFTLMKNNLFFYSISMSSFSFKRDNIDYDIYNLFINSNNMYSYNIFYYFYICTLNNNFKNSLYMEGININSNLYKTLKINFNKFDKSPSNSIHFDVKTFNSFITSYIKTNSNNYYINKLFLSHTFINI